MHNHRGKITKDTYFAQKFDEYFEVEFLDEPEGSNKTISTIISCINKNKDKRFFIYYHIMSPHIPYTPDEIESEFFNGEDFSFIEGVRNKVNSIGDLLCDGWTEKKIGILRGFYDSNLKHSDKFIGVLYNKLKEIGLAKKTLIIITSDHGENLGEHNSIGHGGLPWDTVTHVPLIMVYPRLISAGTKVNGLTESIDVMPSILDICKMRLPQGKSMDGVSLMKFIKNPGIGKKAVFTERSIRTERYKYINNVDSFYTNVYFPELLYDLRTDPGEEKNIAENLPLIKEKMRATFHEVIQPYRNRFEESRRKNAPDYPFYYEIDSFRIIPDVCVERCWIESEDITALKKSSSEKPWVLGHGMVGGKYGLFCLSPQGKHSPPITLSTSLPNGDYEVSIFLESHGNISLPVEEFGFKFRFKQQMSFVPLNQIDFVKNENGAFYYYLNCGQVTVINKEFSIEIDFCPPDGELYVIRRIRFIPIGSKVENIDEEELRRREENLKALGYL